MQIRSLTAFNNKNFSYSASFFRLRCQPILKMSCNTCSKSFGLITREKDCKNCGFSYCSSCLRYKQFVAKINQNVKVCGPCNRVLSDPKWVIHYQLLTKTQNDLFLSFKLQLFISILESKMQHPGLHHPPWRKDWNDLIVCQRLSILLLFTRMAMLQN